MIIQHKQFQLLLKSQQLHLYANMMNFLEDFFCGSCSGIANCTSGFFLDTVKVRMQINPHSGMMATIMDIIRKEGFMHLYNGIYYPLMTAPLISAFSFSSYQFYKNIRGKTELSYIDGLQNGAFAGLIISFIVTPVQLIKCTMQMDSGNKYNSSRDCFTNILKERGIRGLYKGRIPTVMREIPSYAFQFGTYQFLKEKFIGKHKQHLNLGEALIVGPLSAFCSQLFTYPLDVVKTKIQVNPLGTYQRLSFFNDEGVVDCFRNILKTEGWKGLLIGLKPCLLRALIADGIGIVVYEKTHEAISKFQKLY